MYSKHYFVFFDKTNDFTIDEFGNIGRTMEDGPFNSNEIGRHVDTETIFMVRANAEKLVNAWEGLDVYYIGDNVIHLHGQPLGYVSITTPTTAWRNTTNRNAWIQTIKDYIWGIYNRIWAPSWQDCRNHAHCNNPGCGTLDGLCTYRGNVYKKNRIECRFNYPGVYANIYDVGCGCDHNCNGCINDSTNTCVAVGAQNRNNFRTKWIDNIDHHYWLY